MEKIFESMTAQELNELAQWLMDNTELDKAEIIKVVELAIEKGSTDAMIERGHLCHTERVFDGRNEEEDKEALGWFLKAAEAGNAEAMNIVGNYYYYGWGVEPNREIGNEWLKKAAALGHEDASFDLMLNKFIEEDPIGAAQQGLI